MHWKTSTSPPTLSEGLSVAMVFPQPVHHLRQGQLPCGCDNPGLTHASAQGLPTPHGPGDEVPWTGQHAADRGSQTLAAIKCVTDYCGCALFYIDAKLHSPKPLTQWVTFIGKARLIYFYSPFHTVCNSMCFTETEVTEFDQ